MALDAQDVHRVVMVLVLVDVQLYVPLHVLHLVQALVM